jgi:uncharacterized membrane protein YgcG
MQFTDAGPFALTLIASLSVAVVLLAVRITVMQRVHRKRQRENRQETERLKSLVAAYRSLAGSFSPAAGADNAQIEETLSDIVLFGSLRQVALAAQCINALKRGESPDYQILIEELRSDVRVQLGLDKIPASLTLPPSGPGRPPRHGRGEGDGEGRGRGGGGGGGGGGLGGGAIGAGSVGAGLYAADGVDTGDGR